MRILFCSPVRLDPRLGMVKHALELADALRGLGWEADAVGPDEIAGGPIHATPENFPPILREFLRRHAEKYDVIEYDHVFLPFPRADFPETPLFVARCMLLHHHFLSIAIPPIPGFWPGLRHRLNAGRRRRGLGRLVAQTDETVRNADLTVVSNGRDAEALAAHGADARRIAILPLGATPERLAQLAAVPEAVPSRPVVGFIGTFDPRKGMREFPRIVERMARRIPGVTFRLLGTAGLVPDAAGVLRYFPRRLRPIIDVRPRYEPEELPRLLDGVSVGIFPSRVESFGYGVLEMLAAAIPVIAYDAPGPDVLLGPESLVPAGAYRLLADRTCALVANPDALGEARREARKDAARFDWGSIALRTADVYTHRLHHKAELSDASR